MNSLPMRSLYRPSRSTAAQAMAFVAAAWICSGLGPGATAAEKDSENYARALAIGVCAGCHGPHGNSQQPRFPRLAGQKSAYLATQLRNFRGQTRGDADAIAFMWGMAAELSDDTVDALADYYATERPTASKSNNSAQVALGGEIYLHGIQSRGVQACAPCHGADAHGIEEFPRLAGQHSQYLLKQLGAFRSNMRKDAVMRAITLNLKPREMQAIASYIESQP